MKKAEHISNRLSAVQKTLDEIAAEIRNSDLPYIRAEIENIGTALASLCDIQQTIYTHNPHLVPEHLKEKSPYPAKWNQEYAKLLIENESLLAKNNPREAVRLTENFIQSNPPDLFINMAGAEAKRIKDLFKL